MGESGGDIERHAAVYPRRGGFNDALSSGSCADVAIPSMATLAVKIPGVPFCAANLTCADCSKG
jgi:hypothetical protein